MQSRFTTAALVAASVLASTAFASAQNMNAGGGTPGNAGVMQSPATPPANLGATNSSPGTTTGAGSAATTTAPVRSGSTSYNSLPGDNPSAPGFPGKVGR